MGSYRDDVNHGMDEMAVAKVESNVASVDSLLEEYDALSQLIVEESAKRNRLANLISERNALQQEKFIGINEKFNAYLNGDRPMQDPRR